MMELSPIGATCQCLYFVIELTFCVLAFFAFLRETFGRHVNSLCLNQDFQDDTIFRMMIVSEKIHCSLKLQGPEGQHISRTNHAIETLSPSGATCQFLYIGIRNFLRWRFSRLYVKPETTYNSTGYTRINTGALTGLIPVLPDLPKH